MLVTGLDASAAATVPGFLENGITSAFSDHSDIRLKLVPHFNGGCVGFQQNDVTQ